LLVSQAPHAIKAIRSSIVAIDRRKEPESITREQNRTTRCAIGEQSRHAAGETKSDDETLRTQVQCNMKTAAVLVSLAAGAAGLRPALPQRAARATARAAPRMAISALLFDCALPAWQSHSSS